jgi:hypothetical protein
MTPSRDKLITTDQQEINRELGHLDTPISRPRALGSMEPQAHLVTYLPEDLPILLLETFRAQGLPDRLVSGGCLVAEGLVDVRWTLELVVPLTVQEGEAIMSLLVSDQMESPPVSNSTGIDIIKD